MKKYIAKLIINFFNFVYKKQDEKHLKRMNKLKKQTYSGKCLGGSFHTNSAATLTINQKALEKTKVNQEKIENLMNKYLNEPKKLFEYIKGAKTQVHVNKFAKKILSKIDEVEGFILPKTGIKALYLNLVFNKKISFKTNEMFVISGYNLSQYILAYQFYIWYSYKMKLSGYDLETQEKFNHVFEICETSKIDTLSYEEILSLKTAIRRDVEAIEFVEQYSKKKMMSKKSLEKIKLGKAINV